MVNILFIRLYYTNHMVTPTKNITLEILESEITAELIYSKLQEIKDKETGILETRKQIGQVPQETNVLLKANIVNILNEELILTPHRTRDPQKMHKAIIEYMATKPNHDYIL